MGANGAPSIGPALFQRQMGAPFQPQVPKPSCDLTSLVDEGDGDRPYAGSGGLYVLGSGFSVRNKSPKTDSCQQTGRSYVGWGGLSSL